MTALIKQYAASVAHLFFPHLCSCCGTDVLHKDTLLCAPCLHQLPTTGFLQLPNNVMEVLFWGRIPIVGAGAAFYYTKQSAMQHLIKEVKYRNNPQMGKFLGRLLGYELQKTHRFDGVDALVPLPLNDKKEAQRGYNQAMMICEGLSEVWQKPIIGNAVAREQFTESQTTYNRVERWQNMEGVFNITQPEALVGKHIALIDDIVTTGATLEACGREITKVSGTKLSIISVAYTTH